MPECWCFGQACTESILTSVSSAEREKEKPAAQNRLGMGVSAASARRLPRRRSMPSGPKWLARSRVGLSSNGTLASGPRPWKVACFHTFVWKKAEKVTAAIEHARLRTLFFSQACLEGHGAGCGRVAVL